MTRTILLAAALGGCVIVPSTKTTIKDLGTEQSKDIEGAQKALVIALEASPSAIKVMARRERECERQTLAVSEVTRTKHAKLGGTTDPRGRIFGLLLAPVLIPISAAVTGIVLAGSDDVTERKTKVLSSSKFPCVAVAANLPVRVTLPSGRTLERTTDAAGMFELAIPDSEPYAGTIVVRAEQLDESVKYTRPMPAITAVRELALSCAAQHRPQGGLVVKVTVGGDGAPEGVVTDDGSGELATCVTLAIAKLRFGDAHRGKTLVFRLPPKA